MCTPCEWCCGECGVLQAPVHFRFETVLTEAQVRAGLRLAVSSPLRHIASVLMVAAGIALSLIAAHGGELGFIAVFALVAGEPTC